MSSLKNSTFYQEALQEINYPFGNYYLFDGFVVAEVNEGVIFSWHNHGKRLTEDIRNLYHPYGKNLIFVSNRINDYSVKPVDWLNFFKQRYSIKGYAVVSYSKTSYLNALLEKLFVKTDFKRFKSLEDALDWAKRSTDHRMVNV